MNKEESDHNRSTWFRVTNPASLTTGSPIPRHWLPNLSAGQHVYCVKNPNFGCHVFLTLLNGTKDGLIPNHTPSRIAFQHLPPLKLCQNWLRHWRGTLYLRAAVHRRCQRPRKGLGTKKTGSNISPGKKRKKKKRCISIQMILVLFVLCAVIKETLDNLSCLLQT